ncbi:MAG: arginine decarboxylase, pyruvoyl-dependent [Candidatus Micrarchaeota archaeon]
MVLVPKKMFLTKGVGKGRDTLSSFESALRDAGIAQFNIVSVSSIFPPGCKTISKERGLKQLKAGQVIFCVMARIASDEPNRLIAASIGCALPKDKKKYGYLSEHHAYGQTDEKAGEYSEDLAASMLATTLGIPFNPAQAWNEKEKYFKMSKEIVRTTNITQSAICDKNGMWNTVIAVAVFIL